MGNHEKIGIGPDAPALVRTIIEVPKHASNKYKYTPETDTFRYDRTMYSPLYYPYDYGWICGTRSVSDQKPLSCLVMSTNPTFSGCLVVGRPVATLHMSDQRGDDPKILCVASCDPRFENIHKLADFGKHTLLELEHFFEIYQSFQRSVVTIDGWDDIDNTLKLVSELIVSV